MCSGHFSSLDHGCAPPRRTAQAQEHPISDYVGLVIAYRNHDLVAGVLERLAAQTVQPRTVLVVDNGGTLAESDLDGMPLADRSALISRPDNPGYGPAVNLAREHLGGSALLALTHDAEFGPNLAASLLEALEDRSARGAAGPGPVGRAGCAGPLLRFAAQPERVFSAGGRLTPAGRAFHLSAPLSTQPYPVDWLDGAIVMYTAEALDAIGWIDEDYFLYFEDVDTGWRMARAGFRSLVVPGEVAHQQTGEHPVYLGTRNMALFSRKAGIGTLPSLGAAVRRVGVESLRKLRRGKAPQLGEAWRGWRDGRAGAAGKPAASA